jgi:iron(III) transport system substrate-binding protein
MKKFAAALIATIMLVTFSPVWAGEKQKLVVYTSMKEVLIGKLRDAFVQKHKDIEFDYYSAGAGKIMAKIAAERQSGTVVADILWTSEIPDFYQLKAQNMLEQYESPEAKNILSPVKDSDACFTPARLGTLGIAFNTKRVRQAPKTWDDILGPDFQGAFGLANPALSGTTYVSLAMIVDTFGWEFIRKLKANGAKMGQGSGQVVDDTASGDLKGCIGVDYITVDKIQKGANLGLVFPPEMLVIPSPVAIIKGTKNLEAAKSFVDFLLSKEGQTLVAHTGTLPIRRDVELPKNTPLVPSDEAVKRAMKADYQKMISEKEEMIKKFTEIMRAK